MGLIVMTVIQLVWTKDGWQLTGRLHRKQQMWNFTCPLRLHQYWKTIIAKTFVRRGVRYGVIRSIFWNRNERTSGRFDRVDCSRTATPWNILWHLSFFSFAKAFLAKKIVHNVDFRSTKTYSRWNGHQRVQAVIHILSTRSTLLNLSRLWWEAFASRTNIIQYFSTPSEKKKNIFCSLLNEVIAFYSEAYQLWVSLLFLLFFPFFKHFPLIPNFDWANNTPP